MCIYIYAHVYIYIYDKRIDSSPQMEGFASFLRKDEDIGIDARKQVADRQPRDKRSPPNVYFPWQESQPAAKRDKDGEGGTKLA